MRNNTNSADNRTAIIEVKQTLTPTIKFPTIPTRTVQIIKKGGDLDVSTHPVTPQRNGTSEQTQRTGRLPKQTTGRAKSSPTEKVSTQLRWQCSSCSPNFQLKTPHFHSGAACDRPETTKTQKLPPIPEVTDLSPLNNINNGSPKIYIHQNSKMTVGSQTSPPKLTQPLNYVVATEQAPRIQTERTSTVP